MSERSMIAGGAPLVLLLIGSRALAFGPPAAVVNHARVEQAQSASGGQDLTITLENVVRETVSWEVEVTSSAGWITDASVKTVSLASAWSDDPTATVGVHVTPIDADCPPEGLVVDLRMVDPTGFQYVVRERLYYANGDRGLVPIDYETYLADYDVIDSGKNRAKGCQRAQESASVTSEMGEARGRTRY